MNNKTTKYRRSKAFYSNDKPVNSFSFKNFYQRVFSSDLIILAIFSGVSYYIVSMFYSGYFFYFGIPEEFMSINTAKQIPIILLMSFLLFGFYSFGWISFYFLIEIYKLHKLNFDLLLIVFFITLNVISITMFWERWILILLIILYEIIISVIGFILGRSLESIENKLRDSNNSISVTDIALYRTFLKAGKFGMKNFSFLLTIFLLMFAFILSYSFGAIVAKIRTNFTVAYTNTECVVLYSNDLNFICAPFDRQKKEVEKKSKMIDLSDKENQEKYLLSYENIGPLHLKPTPTPTPLPTFTPTVTNTPLPTKTPVPTQTATP